MAIYQNLLEYNALQFAIDNNQEKIVNLFLSEFPQKIDINARSMEAFIGNEIETFEKTALHLAAEIEDLEIIMLFLENKEIDLNIEDDGHGKKLG